MKKNFFLIFIVVLNAILVIYLYYIDREKDIHFEKVAGLLKSEKTENKKIFEKLRIQFINDGNRISAATLIENSKGEIISIKSVVEDKPLLVFFIKSINCSVCLDEEMAIFAEIIRTNKINDRIIVIRTFQSERQKFVYENQYNVPVYEVKNNTLNLPAEQNQSPFYFIITPELLVQNTFLPDRYNIDFSKQYLQIAAKKVAN